MAEKLRHQAPWKLAWTRRPISMLLATWAGVGHLPGAPGTYAALLALPLAVWASFSEPTSAFGMLLIVAVAGVFVSDRAEQALESPDSNFIVIDEVIGMWLALVFFPELGWLEVLVGFVVFRICDIYKPPGVRYFDDVGGGGFAIVMDDVIAGLYAVPFVALVRFLV
jgi:phosphatidylglycerophosphatase A